VRIGPQLVHLLQEVLAAGENVLELVKGRDGWHTDLPKEPAGYTDFWAKITEMRALNHRKITMGLKRGRG
jgi:hypothetical protein